MIDIPRDDLVLMMEAGYIYLAMGKFAEARQLFEGIIAIVPKHDVPRVALSNVLFAQSKFLPAIRVLKETIEINDKSAFAYAHLGEAYLFYGKMEEAHKNLDKALELDPDSKIGSFVKALKHLMSQGYNPVELQKKAKSKNLPSS